VNRILIVDDEPAILDAMAILLADEGYSVQTAPDGRVALQMIAGELPDLLITDVLMPGLDGWALLAQVRAHSPDLPVIVISAVERRDAPQREILITDYTVFLRKPFGIAALLAIVHRLTKS
jgi:two-component system, sensor histidine kinase and response regulator